METYILDLRSNCVLYRLVFSYTFIIFTRDGIYAFYHFHWRLIYTSFSLGKSIPVGMLLSYTIMHVLLLSYYYNFIGLLVINYRLSDCHVLVAVDVGKKKTLFTPQDSQCLAYFIINLFRIVAI